MMRKDLSVFTACLGRRERNGRFEKGSLPAVDRADAFVHVRVLGRSRIDFEQGFEKAKPLVT